MVWYGKSSVNAKLSDTGEAGSDVKDDIQEAERAHYNACITGYPESSFFAAENEMCLISR
ncbi:MAG: hypothetical protein ABIB93_04640 [Chloroflexota bacterium]